MLKSIEKLAMGLSNSEGNHTKDSHGNIIIYRYHGNAICTINTKERTVHYDSCGWKTSSTTRAINSYKQLFSSYSEV